jgi:Type IV secretory system Conjugative DNA transfer/TraM recognition site of TraD and TraG
MIRGFLVVWFASGLLVAYQLGRNFGFEHLVRTFVGSAVLYLPCWSIWQVLKRLKRLVRPAVVAAGTLDHVLFRWTREDAFTVRDLLQSIAVFGQTGSGKSSGSGLTFARAVAKLPKSGGLILASKPEDKQFWMDRFREQGRANDLLIFDESGKLKFNFLDFVRLEGGDAREITAFIMTTAEVLDEGSGHESEPFWRISQQRLIWNAVEAVRLAEGEVTYPRIKEFIETAAESPLVFSDPKLYAKWVSRYHNQTMEKASRAAKTAREEHDWKLVLFYWTSEYPSLDLKPRSSILAGVQNALHTMNTGIVRDLVSTTTNVSPLDMDRGKWVLIDLPIDRFGESGKIIMSGWKYSVQRHVLRRHAKPGDSTIGIWCDEAQMYTSSFDPKYLAMCRSHYGYQIFLTQSYHSYVDGGQASEHRAKALLSNFSLKVAHTIGDAETAKYLCSLVGQYRETFISYSPKADDQIGGSLSEQYEDKLKVSELLTGLRAGQGGVVDGVIIKTGMPFKSTNENFLRVQFSQD